MNKCVLLLLSVLFCSSALFAQKKFNPKKDTVNTAGDTTSVLLPFKPLSKQPKQKIYHPDSTHSPHKAVIKSLILPGLGQVYNHRYWKLPLIYGGFAGLGYSYYVAETNYKPLLRELEARARGTTTDSVKYTGVGTPLLTNYKDFYHRNRDLTIILTVGFWAVQAIDAYIDAKFQHSYTMDNNLSFKLTPTLINAPMYAYSGYIPGLRLTLKMR